MTALIRYEAMFQRQFRRERVFRDRLNPFEMYNDDEIYDRFRFHRWHVLQLVDLVRCELELTKRKGKYQNILFRF